MWHRFTAGVGAHKWTHPRWDISSKGRRIHEKTYGDGIYTTGTLRHGVHDVVVKRGALQRKSHLCVPRKGISRPQ